MSEDLFDLLTVPPRDGLSAVTATVESATADVALLRTRAGQPAIMPITEFYPNRRWQVGGTYHLLQLDDTSRPTLSARRPELLELLLSGMAPELRDGRVRIMSVVRQVGIRSKVAVAATESGIDPVGACLGKAANRVQALSKMLLGERVDIVAWHPDPQIFVKNAIGATVLSTEIEAGRARVTVPAHQYQAAVGGGGLNALLVARLTGVRLSVVPAE